MFWTTSRLSSRLAVPTPGWATGCVLDRRQHHLVNLDRLRQHLHDAPRGGHRRPGRSSGRDHARPGRCTHRGARGPDQGTREADRRPAHRPPRRCDLHLAAQGLAPSALPGCWPRLEMPEAASRLPKHSPAWPAPPLRPNRSARSRSSRSDGPLRNSCAALSSTLLATPTTPTPGPPSPTRVPEHAVTDIIPTTPTASRARRHGLHTHPGCCWGTASSSPHPPNNTTPSNVSNAKRLDTGLLMPNAGCC